MSGKKLFKATFVLMVVTIISKGIGFFRDALVVSTFGGGGTTDAYQIAVSVPDTIYAIIGLAISTTFIPALSKAFHKDGNKGMYNLANNIISILTVISIIVCILGFIFTEEIVHIIAHGFEGEKFELTVILTRITLINIVLLPINSCFSAILQYKEDFIIPGILGLFFNLPIIVYLVLVNPSSVIGLSIANVIGNVFRVIVQIPSLYKHGYRFKFFINLKDERIRTIMLLLIPVIIGAGANSFNMMIDQTIASSLGDGAIVALSYSQKITVLINAVFTMSILTVVYPTMSKKLHEGDLNSFLEYLCKAIRLTAILLLPIMSGLLIYRTELITICFEHGEFGANSTLLTSMALIGYALQLPFLGLRDMLNSSFFSMEKTRTTSINSIIGVFVNVILSVLLVRYIGVAGISIASAVAAMLTSVLLFISMKKMADKFDINQTIISLLKMTIATVGMTIVVIILNIFLKELSSVVQVCIGTLVGAITYFALTKLLKISEVEEVIAILLRKNKAIE